MSAFTQQVIRAMQPKLVELAEQYAEIVVDEAKRRAPVGKGRARTRPGRLAKETISARQIEARLRREFAKSVNLAQRQEAEEEIAAAIYGGRPVPEHLTRKFKLVVTRGAFKGREVSPVTLRVLPRAAEKQGGRLRDSIRARRPVRTSRGVSVVIEATAPHARYVEFGTHHPVGSRPGQPKRRPYRIPPRPFLVPALQSLRSKLR